MKNLKIDKQEQIAFFKPNIALFQQPKGTTIDALFDTLTKSTKLADVTNEVLAASDPSTYKRKKNTLLPFVKFSVSKWDTEQLEKDITAAANDRLAKPRAFNTSHVLEHSGFFCLDYDHIDPAHLPTVKQCLIEGTSPKLVFVSPSGNGLKVVYHTEDAVQINEHKRYYAYLVEHADKATGLQADKTNDINRACYICTDVDAYYDTEATFSLPKLATVEPTISSNTSTTTTSTTPAIIAKQNNFKPEITSITSEQMIALVDKYTHIGKDITQEYQTWVNIGMSIKHCFKEDGLQYFKQISQFNPQYSPDDCTAKYNTFEPTSLSIDYFITLLRTTCNIKLDTPVQAPYSDLIHGPYYAFILNQIQQHKIIRNLLSQEFEINNEVLSDSDMKSIQILIGAKYGRQFANKNSDTRMPEKDFFLCMYSSHVSSYDPVKDFINSNIDRPLEMDYIGAFLDVLQVTGVTRKLIRKWYIGIIAMYFEPKEANSLMPILCGKGNSGKTYMSENLMPECLRLYQIKEKFNMDKDFKISLTKNLMFIEDEFDSHKRGDIEGMKKVLSDSQFSLRPPYGAKNQMYNRNASFIGTSNNMEVVTDMTGNRRLIPIVLDSYSHKDFNEIDKDLMFLQGYEAWKNGEQWKVNNKEIEELKEASDDFIFRSEELELMQENVKLPKENETPLLCNTTDFKRYLLTIMPNIKMSAVKHAIMYMKIEQGWDEQYNKKYMISGNCECGKWLIDQRYSRG